MLANALGLSAMIAASVALDSTEFTFYGTVFLFVLVVLWATLRAYHFPWWLLAAFELGVAAHFAGGLLYPGGVRLYDTPFLGITFDKYVHAYNAGIGTLAFGHLFAEAGLCIRRGWSHALAACAASTAGIGVELVEYFAVISLARTGVGGYANNLTDLFANSIGAIIAIAILLRLQPGERAPQRA